MKNIIILLTTILSVYSCKASSVRQPKKNSFIRVKKNQKNPVNNNVSANANQINNNKIATLNGFKSMELLNPDFLNQPATKNSVNNTNKVPNKAFPVGNTLYNNQQNSNQIVNNNSVAKNTQAVHYNNNHITNSAPITLANQMNTIYNGNKQNQSPQGSAYANYQSSINNSYAGGLSQQPVQPQLINPPLQSNQQLSLPINNNQMNNNQNQSNLGVYYGNYQNL